MAVTHNLTVGAGAIPHDSGRLYVLDNVVDLGANSVATTGIVQALAIAANTYVINVVCTVEEATGLTSTATVGDGSGANSWDAEVNLNAAVNTKTVGAGGTDAYVTAGKLYTAADTIDLVCTITSGPCTAGKVRVQAICVDLSERAPVPA